MKFWYEGFNVGGIVSSGEFEAENKEEAAEYIRGKGIYPQQIKEVGVEEIKPVLPQGKKTFEDELGFIDTKPLREQKLEEAAKKFEEAEKKAISASEEFQKETDEQVFKATKLEAKKWEESVCGKKCQCEEGVCSEDISSGQTQVLREKGQIELDMAALAEGANEMIEYMMAAIGADSGDKETKSVIRSRVQESVGRLMDKVLWDYVIRSRSKQ